MKKTLRSAILLGAMGLGCLSAVSSGFAHEGDEAQELGHHWAVPAYTQEIRLQLAGIFIAVCVFAAVALIAKSIRKKRAQE